MDSRKFFLPEVTCTEHGLQVFEFADKYSVMTPKERKVEEGKEKTPDYMTKDRPTA